MKLIDMDDLLEVANGLPSGWDEYEEGKEAVIECIESATVIHTQAEFSDLRNFACQLCGKYKTAHEGSCNGCKWEEK
jgi:hypothetical protein